MTLHTSPILTSLLDTDAYKLHMQQAVYHHYRDVHVAAEFRCRGDELLGVYADEIRAQIDAMSQLSLRDDEYAYLASLPFFQPDYLNWLKTFRFNPAHIQVSQHQGKLDIRITGPWHEVILWEVPLLAVISEVVHQARHPGNYRDAALAQLHHTLSEFRTLSQDVDLRDFRLMDFGTRRRFSRSVHHDIVRTLNDHFPWLIGTSNYFLAHQFALTPVGTQAHEWFQAHQQISPTLANSQRAALDAWLREYPHQLGIALTDCITMDAFLRDFDKRFAERYQGLRHDSGDPIEWGEKAIAHYRALGIDPMSKTLVFSDNLNLAKALHLYRHFQQRIPVVFGIGTRLTCDIPGVKPLNIVIKLVECNGKPVAKLSDSPGKTICQDQAFVSELRKAFDLPRIKKAS
ncbi:nicotinate phosphoribosyltransferase [Dickeya lacustris]|uniref:Nicotinate phosphoribosyltransferase n=1 Tax=Dickeya lacustris TaxID=2259638 RepID=A0ABY8G969_9GAMM|nr:nicotinate phosphoribosyltransferase [Dickeya lacustris]WFN56486.1 nicotinate phosphoribosyltransferase [Dickeya lacustris]